MAGSSHQPKLFICTGMQRFLECQVELNRAGRGAMGVAPGSSGQCLQIGMGHAMQTIRGRVLNPPANRLEKILLIHGLIGAARLQPLRPIGREQQQRLIGAIRFHSGRQQIGNRCAGGGHHRHSPPGGRRQSKGKKSSGTFIHRCDQPEPCLISKHPRSHCQRP